MHIPGEAFASVACFGRRGVWDDAPPKDIKFVMDPSTMNAASTPAEAFHRMYKQNVNRISELEGLLEEEQARLSQLKGKATKAATRSPRTPKGTRTPKSPRPRKIAKSPSRSRASPRPGPSPGPSPTSVVFDTSADYCDVNMDAVDVSSQDQRPSVRQWSATALKKHETAGAQYGRGTYPQIAAYVGSKSEKKARAHGMRLRRREAPSSSIASAFAALEIPTQQPQPTLHQQPLAVHPSQVPPVSLTPALEGLVAPSPIAQLGTAPDVIAGFAHTASSVPLGSAANGSSVCSSNPRPTTSFSSISSTDAQDVSDSFDMQSPVLPGQADDLAVGNAPDRPGIELGMDCLGFDEPFATLSEKVATAKSSDAQPSFDWNCCVPADNYEMPADFTENFLLLENI